MTRNIHSFLDLTALPQVGAVLLDPRPAWVWAEDGSAILWANAAGIRFFGEHSISGARERRFSRSHPVAIQLAALAPGLRVGEPQMSLLRFASHAGTEPVLCLATRLPIDDEHDAILVASLQAPQGLEPLPGRAFGLAAAVAEMDEIVVVTRPDGRLVAASGGLDAIDDIDAVLEELAAATSPSGRRILRRRIAFRDSRRPAGMTVISTPEGEFRLAILGAAIAAGATRAETIESGPMVGPESASRPREDAPARPDPRLPDPLASVAPATDSIATVAEIGTGSLATDAADPNPASPIAADADPVEIEPPALPADAPPLPAAAASATAAPASEPTPPVIGSAEAEPPATAPAPASVIDPIVAAILRAAAAGTNQPGSPAAAPQARPDTGRFVFRARPEPVRFAFQLDERSRFTQISPEFADVVGARSSDIIGLSWADVAAEFGFDAPEAVERLLARRDTWSGVTVYWPIEGTAEAIAVDLAALPAFSRGGGFEGFRGFGVCRTKDRRPRESGDAVRTAAVEEALDVGDELRSAGAEAAPDAAMTRSNVVRLPSTAGGRDRNLTGSEQEAFRRIAEALRTNPPRSARVPAARRADIPPTAESVSHPTAPIPAPTDSPVPSAQPAAGVSEPPVPTIATAAAEPPADTLPLRFLDRLPLGILVFRDQAILYANHLLLDRLGFADLHALASAGIDAIFASGADERSDGGRTRLRASGGAEIAVEARLHVVPWENGMATMVTARVERDPPPPDREAADRAAAIARIDELEAVLDTATDGVLVLDAEARIMSLNRSAEALFGVEGTDVLGTPFTNLLADESRRSAIDYLEGLSQNGVASVLNDGREIIGRVPSGGLIPLFMTMGRLAERGKFCAVLRDITQWKNAEEELIAARRSAEIANQQKSDFLARISHEIRTPLNAVIGFSEVMLEERFGPIGSERYREYLKDIRLSGSHLMSLINDLLDLSKIEAGKLDLAFTAVPINDILQECVALMQPEANRRRIIIRTSLGSLVPKVVADQRSIRQIVLNLLSNAVKFTLAGGQVIVSTALEETGEVVLRIRDTGIGMSEKDLDLALKPFQQIATSGRNRSDGTGLGLPLTKALVEANRATFAIDSAPNQGTLARITFPTSRVLQS